MLRPPQSNRPGNEPAGKYPVQKIILLFIENCRKMVKLQIISKFWDQNQRKMITTVEEVQVPNKEEMKDITALRMRKQFESYFKDR